MTNPKLSSKALTAWLLLAMLGPLALASARASWVAVLVATILCGVLCVAVFACLDRSAGKSRLYAVAVIVWNCYAAAVVADQGSICWPGKGSELVIPLVLIALAATASAGGAQSASAVSATLCPICVVIFAPVFASGVGNVQMSRLQAVAPAPDGMLLFVLLLPMAAAAIEGREPAKLGGTMTAVGIFALAISVASIGMLSLPVALTRRDAFFELAKSLELFGRLQRFESVTAVAVTISIYAMLSLLYSGIFAMAENWKSGRGREAVFICASVSAAVVLAGLWISPDITALLALLIWGILSVLSHGLPFGKTRKKSENKP